MVFGAIGGYDARTIQTTNERGNEMSLNKIEGVPEGWELVRIGTPVDGERYIASDGGVVFCMGMGQLAKNFLIIRKIEPPKPKYTPWTFDTCPIGCVIKRKDGLDHALMIVSKTDVSAGQMGGHYLYEALFRSWRQLDGTPCGTVEVQE